MKAPSTSLLALRRASLAILAISMLLLQPLASSAWCMATGMDCCGAESEAEELHELSCCGMAESDAEGATGEEAPAEPCCCGIEDGPISDLPPVDSGSVPSASAAATFEDVLPAHLGSRASSRQPAHRARAPGLSRPPRVLYQVFRL